MDMIIPGRGEIESVETFSDANSSGMPISIGDGVGLRGDSGV